MATLEATKLMADSGGYGFDEEGARRIVENTRRAERQELLDRRGLDTREPRTFPNVQHLRVTGAATVATGISYYPARLRKFDPATGWADVTASDALWLIHTAGTALVTTGAAIYDARQMRDSVTVSGTTRPLFAVSSDVPANANRIALTDLGGCVGGFFAWNGKALEAIGLRLLDTDCEPITTTDPCPP